jgi:uncharacterized Ntn-hydrolase superfamily protein
MTFSILGVDARSGKIGFCQTSSTTACGWRAASVVPRKGVITIQAHADVRLLDLGVRLIDFGYSPQRVVEELAANDPYWDYRQIAVVYLDGRSAAVTHDKAIEWAGHVDGDNFVATGNVLVGQGVVDAMAESFRSTADQELEDRLIVALEAGVAAGGQPDGLNSAAMRVVGHESIPLLDLRVDMHESPVAELRDLFEFHKPLIPYYLMKARDPSSVTRAEDFMREGGLRLAPSALKRDKLAKK